MAQAHSVIDPATPTHVVVADAAGVFRAVSAARQVAAAIGFTGSEREEIALTVSELAANLVRHAGGGTIKLIGLLTEDRKGIQIESEDRGPGISDVELALTDGYSTAGGLGKGLGTVNRLMDELAFQRLPSAGLQIVCQRWMRPPNSRFAAQRLDCGGATRARGQGPDNGDALVIRQWNSLALLGVVDGLGHGQFARKAANAARTYLEQHYDQPLDNLFRGVERACCATRGVVMALARFDLLQGKLLAASVGNVEVRVVEGPAPFHLMPRRGILGLRAPSPHITGHTWSEGSLLIMHSDGLAGRWGWHEFKELADQSPAVIARGLLNRLAKPEDDATVLVARNSRA